MPTTFDRNEKNKSSLSLFSREKNKKGQQSFEENEISISTTVSSSSCVLSLKFQRGEEKRPTDERKKTDEKRLTTKKKD